MKQAEREVRMTIEEAQRDVGRLERS